MRLLRIFMLNFQQVFEERARSFVWFLLSLFSPLLMILFWKGAKTSGGTLAFSAISSYYLLLVVGGSLLMSHTEENISLIDIQEGRLVSYLLKPFNYFFLKFFETFPYRVLQGSFGILTLVAFIAVLHIQITTVVTGFLNIFFAVFIVVGAIFLAQLYKMTLGFITFWVKDASGFFQLSEMILFLFAGYIVPLSLYPTSMGLVAYALPFSYMIYFPVAAIEGMFSTLQLAEILLMQGMWIGIFIVLYVLIWRKGVKEFTGVGQ